MGGIFSGNKLISYSPISPNGKAVINRKNEKDLTVWKGSYQEYYNLDKKVYNQLHYLVNNNDSDLNKEIYLMNENSQKDIYSLIRDRINEKSFYFTVFKTQGDEGYVYSQPFGLDELTYSNILYRFNNNLPINISGVCNIQNAENTIINYLNLDSISLDHNTDEIIFSFIPINVDSDSDRYLYTFTLTPTNEIY